VKTLLKSLVMWLYCHEYICAATVAKVFARFDLKGH